jgi:hypothetical protein
LAQHDGVVGFFPWLEPINAGAEFTWDNRSIAEGIPLHHIPAYSSPSEMLARASASMQRT